MAKQQSFADKAAKAAMKRYTDCPKCNTQMLPVLFVNAQKQSNGSRKFRQQMVRVCKCNEKEVYGT